MMKRKRLIKNLSMLNIHVETLEMHQRTRLRHMLTEEGGLQDTLYTQGKG